MPVAKAIANAIENSSWIRAMFEAGAKLKAEKGPENVFDFSLGNPNLSPPKKFFSVLKELAASEEAGVHGYMPNAGYPDVRAKVAEYLAKLHGVPITGNEVVMTVGAGGAINAVLKAIMNKGDNIVVPMPYFVEYDGYAANHGGVVKRAETKPDFSLDLESIEKAITPKTCAVLINTPNNPTGAVYSKSSVAQLGKILRAKSKEIDRAIYLINDEPYRDIVFDDKEVPSVFTAYQSSLVVTSFSKNLSLAGERIGYAAAHPKADDHDHLMAGIILANRILGFVNAPGFMQRAVAQLMGITSDMKAYNKKRDLICKVLDEAGFEYSKPEGAFYVFAKSPIKDDVAFVKAALEENLLLVPGTGFFGPGHFRVAFCCSDETIVNSAEAFKRLRARYK